MPSIFYHILTGIVLLATPATRAAAASAASRIRIRRHCDLLSVVRIKTQFSRLFPRCATRSRPALSAAGWLEGGTHVCRGNRHLARLRRQLRSIIDRHLTAASRSRIASRAAAGHETLLTPATVQTAHSQCRPPLFSRAKISDAASMCRIRSLHVYSRFQGTDRQCCAAFAIEL